jgi:DNA replication protein DnaC
MRSYESQQREDRSIAEQRKETVYSRIPGYADLDARLLELHTSAAAQFAAGNRSVLNELRKAVRDIEEKKAGLLIANDLPADYLEPVYKCPDCMDTGYINNEKCHCFRQKEISILYKQSNLDKLLQEENFSRLSDRYYSGDDLEHFKKAVTWCHSFIDDFGSEYQNLFFYGTVGTGKSFLSCCIAHDLLNSGHSVLYFSAIHFFELLSQVTFHSKDLSASDTMDDLAHCDLLIIDDLGTEITNQFTVSSLFSCLNERHLNQKATILSTNLSLEEIRDRYSDRVFSRITCYYQLCKLTGPDIRIENKKQQNRK